MQPVFDLPLFESASDLAFLLNEARHERKNDEQAQRLTREVAENEEEGQA